MTEHAILKKVRLFNPHHSHFIYQRNDGSMYIYETIKMSGNIIYDTQNEERVPQCNNQHNVTIQEIDNVSRESRLN